MSRPIVIDASVARACGDSRSPPAPACLAALEALREHCHRALVSPELMAEWKNHASRLFWRWLGTMFSRKKVDSKPLADYAPLTSKLVGLATGAKDEEEIRKDVHLLAAALQVNAPVLSLDDKARTRFKELSQKVGEIQGVVWVNPAHPTEGVDAWLRANAPSEPRRQLGQP